MLNVFLIGFLGSQTSWAPLYTSLFTTQYPKLGSKHAVIKLRSNITTTTFPIPPTTHPHHLPTIPTRPTAPKTPTICSNDNNIPNYHYCTSDGNIPDTSHHCCSNDWKLHSQHHVSRNRVSRRHDHNNSENQGRDEEGRVKITT